MIALILLPFALGAIAEMALWILIWQNDTLIELENFDMSCLKP